MALEKTDFLLLAEALRAPDPRAAAEHEAKKARHEKTRAQLLKETKKNKTHAFFKATVNSYVSGIGFIPAGKIVELPLTRLTKDEDGKTVEVQNLPSRTWEKVLTQKELAEAKQAEIDAEEKAALEANEELEDGDAPKGGKTDAPKGGKTKRAADQDIA